MTIEPSADPFDVQLVIDRLIAEVPEFRLVEGVAEYAAIAGLSDFPVPAAYVMLVDEKDDGEQPSRPNKLQRAIVNFGVVIAVRNYRDVKGSETLKDSNALVGKVRKALKGFEFNVAGARPCKWKFGGVFDYDNSTLLWSEGYETQHFLN